MSAVPAVLSRLDQVRPWQEDLYRDLHQHPELSHQEHRTAGKVAERLGQAGFEVHEGIGGTGVVGVLRNGDGPTVLLRADMDALPVREATGLPYASQVIATNSDGDDVPVAHVCGHDLHVTCLLGAAQLLADGADHWAGSLVAVFQPAEETGRGARAMVDDGLGHLIPTPDVAFSQHVLPMPAGWIGTRVGALFSASDSIRITVHGRGGHGAAPHTTIDPVVVAAMIVVRLQTIVSREVPPAQSAVITVGSIQAGAKSNVIPDTAVLQLSVRTYDEEVRTAVLEAIRRIAVAECQASDCPKEPDIERYEQLPLTRNDEATTERVTDAFTEVFGDQVEPMARQSNSEDFGEIPDEFGIPYTYWAVGGIDPERYERAVAADRVSEDIPGNHSPDFAPVLQPTCDIGTQTLVVAALAWLGS